MIPVIVDFLQVVSNEKSKKLKRARSSEQDNAKEYIVDHINSVRRTIIPVYNC
jgi:hypothetical protein